MLTKVCNRCREEKSVEEYTFRDKVKCIRHSYCRECGKKYTRQDYERNHQKYLTRIQARKSTLVEENRERILLYLETHPCVDCGESDPIVLDFDHVSGTKHKEVTKMVAGAYLWDSVLAEIAKCEVRCANCHRRKTARSNGSYRTRSLTDKAFGYEPKD